MCTTTNSIVRILNKKTNHLHNVFLNMTIPCNGFLTRVEFVAHKAGISHISVWRPSGNNELTFVGSVHVSAPLKGFYVMVSYQSILHV